MPIPTFGPSHCLFLRISNASQPTPSVYMVRHWLYYQKIDNNNVRDTRHPRERFVALPLCENSSLQSLSSQTGNVQKTSFPFGCPYKRCSQPLDSIDVCFDPPCPHSHQPLLASDSLDWLSRWQNYKKNGRKLSFLIKIFENFGLFKKYFYL